MLRSGTMRAQAAGSRCRAYGAGGRKLWLLCVLLGILLTGAGQAEEWGLSHSITGTDLASTGYTPAYFDIKNVRKQRAELQLEGIGIGEIRYNFTRQLNLGDNANLRLELPLPVCNGSYRVRITQQLGNEKNDFFSPKISYSGRVTNDSIFTVNAYRYPELAKHLAEHRRAGSATEVVSIMAPKLPQLWQSYAGLQGVILLNAEDTGSLNDRQKTALSQWVRWGGGRLWLIGENATAVTAAVSEFGLSTAGMMQRKNGGISRYFCLTGELWLKTDLDFSKWTDCTIDDMTGIVPAMTTNTTQFTSCNALLEGLGQISAFTINTILIVMGIFLGPLNYLYIRRTKSLLLFYITTPLLALLGSLAVFGYSAFNEGWGAKYRETVLMMHETGTDRAAIYQAQGIYSGLSSPTMTFSEDALLAPFRKTGGGTQPFSSDLTKGIRLTGGWITPRTPSGILSVTPVTTHMGIEVSQDGERYYALNTLTHAVRSLSLQVGGGKNLMARGIKPGERKLLVADGNGKVLSDLRGRVVQHFGNQSYSDLRLVAECDGLPYQEQTGLGGEKLSGTYFYAASGQDWAIPQAGGKPALAPVAVPSPAPAKTAGASAAPKQEGRR